jgi:hypothetical protein
MTALIIIEGLVILILLILVAGLLKSHAEILRELHRLGGSIEGADTPGGPRVTGLGAVPLTELSGTEPSGTPRAVSLTHGRGETLLAFLSTGCSSCMTFWDTLGSSPEMPTPTTRPVIVTRGPDGESPAKVSSLSPSGVAVVMSSDVWDAFAVPVTPFFMLVDGQGKVIGEGSAASWDQLVGLFKRSMEERDVDGPAPGLPPDDPSLYENPVQR